MTRICPPADTLSALVDDALPPDVRDALLAHSAACPHCAAQLAELRALHDAFQDLPPMPVGADLGARVIARLHAEPAPPRARWLEVLVGLFKPVLAWRGAFVPLVGTTGALGLGVLLGGMLLTEEPAMPGRSPNVTLAAMSLFDPVPPGNLCPRADACGTTGNSR